MNLVCKGENDGYMAVSPSSSSSSSCGLRLELLLTGVEAEVVTTTAALEDVTMVVDIFGGDAGVAKEAALLLLLEGDFSKCTLLNVSIEGLWLCP